MTRNERHLKSAKRKVRQFYAREWVGYLTPMEIIALDRAGIQYRDDYQRNTVETARVRKKAGDCSPTWFYFRLGDLTLE